MNDPRDDSLISFHVKCLEDTIETLEGVVDMYDEFLTMGFISSGKDIRPFLLEPDDGFMDTIEQYWDNPRGYLPMLTVPPEKLTDAVKICRHGVILRLKSLRAQLHEAQMTLSADIVV